MQTQTRKPVTEKKLSSIFLSIPAACVAGTNQQISRRRFQQAHTGLADIGWTQHLENYFHKAASPVRP